MDTKEKILHVALALFARDGYEAVSVSMIAGELGMTKGALYKHYENKRAIFDSIVRRMEENDYENAKSFHMPEDLFEKMSDRYRSTEFEQLCAYTLAQFVYWTEDSFASQFRKMLSLERYRNAEMNALYQQYLGAGPLRYVEDLMGQMCIIRVLRQSGRECRGDPAFQFCRRRAGEGNDEKARQFRRMLPVGQHPDDALGQNAGLSGSGCRRNKQQMPAQIHSILLGCRPCPFHVLRLLSPVF